MHSYNTENISDILGKMSFRYYCIKGAHFQL